MKVLVLEGGVSSERAVSLRSAEAVIQALNQSGHYVAIYDTQSGLQGLENYRDKVDVVLPVLHGAGGEDGQVQAVLEDLQLPYLGADPRISLLCFDKVAFKRTILQHHIVTPRWEAVTLESVRRSSLVEQPFVLKPIEGGSSIDTHIVREPAKGFDFEKAFANYEWLLLEELIEGQEITVPILGETALPVIEIIPPEGKEFDYEHKYDGSTQELCPPQHLSEALQQQAQELAETIHKAVGVRDLSRIDFIVRDGIFYVLELNTMPGLTVNSLFPKSAAVAGIDMVQLVNTFVEMVAARR